MKSQAFGAALKSFSKVFDVANAHPARDRIATFATIFDAAPTLNISDLVKRLSALPTSGESGNPTLSDLARLLAALRDLLDKTAKAGVLTDITLMETVLSDRGSMEVGAFARMATEALSAKKTKPASDAAPVRHDLVTHYQQVFEAALGNDEKFTAIYNELSSNAKMGKGEFIALAKQMTGASPRSKSEALKKIRNMHQSVQSFKAKSRATGGRSAA